MDISFMDDDDFVTVSEAAEVLSCGRTTVQRMISDGRLKANFGNSQLARPGHINRMLLIPISEIRKFLGEDH